jgi:hypothetical protein
MSTELTGKKQRKIRNIFINGTFQAKVVVLVVGIALLQGVLGTGFIYVAFQQFINNWSNVVLESGDILEAVQMLSKEILFGVVVTNFCFFLFAIFMGVFFSHKLAGPNYAIKRAINNLLDGVDHHDVVLRDGDEFHDLAERINLMFSEYHLVKKDDDEDLPIDSYQI